VAARYATRADFDELAPDLAMLSTELVAAYLLVTRELIGLSRWGERASFGHAFLTAHLLASTVAAAGAGAGGQLTAEANGPASRSFAVAEPSDPELSSTAYGRSYLLLRRVVLGRGTAIVANRCVPQR
jgi:hypothetical protein